MNNSPRPLCSVYVCAHTDSFADMHLSDIQSAPKCFWACGCVTFITNREQTRDPGKPWISGCITQFNTTQLQTTASKMTVLNQLSVTQSQQSKLLLDSELLCSDSFLLPSWFFFPSIWTEAGPHHNPLHPKPWWVRLKSVSGDNNKRREVSRWLCDVTEE